MPYRSATHRAQRRSCSFPAVVDPPIYVSVNVLTGDEATSAASAVVSDESMPPLRKNPTGTSDIRRRRTARRIRVEQLIGALAFVGPAPFTGANDSFQ